jgi:hypothetical protein
VWGLTLSSRNRTRLKRTHYPFPHTASLKCHRVAQYISVLTVVPHSTNSTCTSPAESHNTTAITLPAEGDTRPHSISMQPFLSRTFWEQSGATKICQL